MRRPGATRLCVLMMAALIAALGLAVPAFGTPSAPAVPSPSATASPKPAVCPAFSVKQAIASKKPIALVAVAGAPVRAKDGSVRIPIAVTATLRGQITKAASTVVISHGVCTPTTLALGNPIIVVGAQKTVGAVKTTGVYVAGGPARNVVLADPQLVCEIQTAAHHACTSAAAALTYASAEAPARQPWLRLAAPGLAAIIAAGLGLLLLRLRRR